MTRSFLALLVLAACNSGGSTDGETGLDPNTTDATDQIDTDVDTDVQDTDVRDTFVGGGDTALESDTDLEDTDVSDTDSGVIVDPDDDQDGYPASLDCDDSNQFVNPGATEVCNEIDDDCDAQIDEGTNDGITYYRDLDSDGYGSASTTRLCGLSPGWSEATGDCNDSDSSVNPGELEVCNGRDDNCSGNSDEDPIDGLTFYEDRDEDDYGDVSSTTNACVAPSGFVADATDCDDGAATTNPGAPEVCNGVDDNCATGVDEGVKTTFYADADFDDYGDVLDTTEACAAPIGYVADATDCDDRVDTTNPGATERCNGVDDNCAGGIDEGVKLTFYADTDSDLYGDAAQTTLACTAPPGFVADATDCDDSRDVIHPDADETNCTDPTDYNCDGSTGFADVDGDGVAACEDCDDNNDNVNPDATEVCNGIDDNCVDGTDEGLTTTFYADADLDTYGDAASTTDACTVPDGYVSDSTDCDDTRALVNPGATEVCNGRDDDCDTQIDESVKLTFYADADSDLFGTALNPVQACVAPTGFVSVDTDCDDTSAAVHPGVTEVCNGIDDNCAAGVDEGVKSTFYADADGDAYGDAELTQAACIAPTGFVDDATDCDDTLTAVNPDATEVCNEVDDDCDTQIDEGVTVTFYADADGDTYGDASASSEACALPATGFSFDATDCDDGRAATHPDATEACNGIDDDCDDVTDDNLGAAPLANNQTGVCAGARKVCQGVSGYVEPSFATIPSYESTEASCDNLDNDCDGTSDEDLKETFYADADSDLFGAVASSTLACTAPTGFVADRTDCDDTNAAINPDATEVCNAIDDDCDADVDNNAADATSWYVDGDEDGFGAGAAQLSCDAVSGRVSVGGDCEDTDLTVYPGAAELCDGQQNDCDVVDWTGDHELGQVSYQDTAGVWSDFTASFTGAVALPAGTLHVCSGIYDVSLSATAAVTTTVVGHGPVEDIILTGAGTHRVLTMTAGNVTLETLTVLDGSAASDGGCVLVDAGNFTARTVSFSQCHAATGGGAVSVRATGAADFRSCDISFSMVSDLDASGGGLSSAGSTTMSDTTVHDNLSVAGLGGGVFADGGTLDLTTVFVVGNTAVSGAGIALGGDVEAFLTGLMVGTNIADLAGGGLYATTQTALFVQDGTFSGNDAGEEGGNVYLRDGDATFDGTALTMGTAGLSGGGLYTTATDLSLLSCDVSSNAGGLRGGGVAVDGGSLTTQDVTLTGNGVAGVASAGGGLYLTNTTANLTGGTVMANEALDENLTTLLPSFGGGIAAWDSFVRLAYVMVSANSAHTGGAIYQNDPTSLGLDLAGTTQVSGNHAFVGGGVYLDAGVARCGTTPDDVVAITGNTASGQDLGAGVFLAGADADLSLLECDMGEPGPADNTAGGFDNQDVTTDIGTFAFGVAATALCNGATGCSVP